MWLSDTQLPTGYPTENFTFFQCQEKQRSFKYVCMQNLTDLCLNLNKDYFASVDLPSGLILGLPAKMNPPAVKVQCPCQSFPGTVFAIVQCMIEYVS